MIYIRIFTIVLVLGFGGFAISDSIAEVIAPGQRVVVRTASTPVASQEANQEVEAEATPQVNVGIAVAQAQQPPAQAGEPIAATGGSVKLNEDGTLTGRVGVLNPNSNQFEGVADVDVHFIQQGKVISKATSGADGTFTVSGLTPDGVYSVISTGANGLGATSVKVVGANADAAASLTLNSPIVPWQDVQAVSTQIQTRLNLVSPSATAASIRIPPSQVRNVIGGGGGANAGGVAIIGGTLVGIGLYEVTEDFEEVASPFAP